MKRVHGKPCILSRLIRAGVAGALIVHWLLAMAMAASPDLHQRWHGDAGHDEHDCAAKLLAAGACDASVAPIAVPPLPLVEAETVHGCQSQTFDPRRCTGVLEHAPPRRA